MTLPRTVADVLADHVVFEVECIDRMYCNVYVPQLQGSSSSRSRFSSSWACSRPRSVRPASPRMPPMIGVTLGTDSPWRIR